MLFGVWGLMAAPVTLPTLKWHSSIQFCSTPFRRQYHSIMVTISTSIRRTTLNVRVCFLFVCNITTDTNLVYLVQNKNDPNLQALASYLAEDTRHQMCENIARFAHLWGIPEGGSSPLPPQLLVNIFGGDATALLGGNLPASLNLLLLHSLSYTHPFIVRAAMGRSFRDSLG